MLAQRFNGKAVKLDNFVDYAKDADILITSQGRHIILLRNEKPRKLRLFVKVNLSL